VNVHLSPEHPRLRLTTEAEIQHAADGGLLEETHYLDLKRGLGTTPGANKELARDLVQFAIDGGHLLVGVDELEGSMPVLDPQPLAGLAERVEQVARTVPDPPLPVRCKAILSAADPLLGYLLVEVPLSGQAPHMVDHVYYRRGDKTRERLSDPEVRRLHETRRAEADTIDDLLRSHVQRDPCAREGATRRNAHLFLVAAPLHGKPEMLMDLVHLPEWWHGARDLVRKAWNSPPVVGGYIGVEGSVGRRSDGAAFHNGHLTDDRRAAVMRDGADPSEDVEEIELTEDGGVRMFFASLGIPYHDGHYIRDDLAAEAARKMAHLCAAIADHTSYLGPWGIGLAATEINGHKHRLSRNSFNIGVVYPYEGGDYYSATIATLAELQQTPGAVTNRLVGRLLRGLRAHELQGTKEYLADL
jgi:hypothetical protein